MSFILGTIIIVHYILPFTHTRGNHARHQPADRELIGVQCLAQGHFCTNSGGTRDQLYNRTMWYPGTVIL